MALTIRYLGDPMLRDCARSLAAQEIQCASTNMLIGQMRDTMREATGVGLAAPQIGESLRIIVVEDRPEYFASLRPEVIAERERALVPFGVMINPEAVNPSEEVIEQPEACLSIPGRVGLVTRSRSLRVNFLDSRGQLTSLEACGWHARIIQHEIDHLNGILYIDRPGTRTFSSDAIARDLLLDEIREALDVAEP